MLSIYEANCEDATSLHAFGATNPTSLLQHKIILQACSQIATTFLHVQTTSLNNVLSSTGR